MRALCSMWLGSEKEYQRNVMLCVSLSLPAISLFPFAQLVLCYIYVLVELTTATKFSKSYEA